MGAIAELAAYVSRFAAWVTYPAMPRYFFHVHLGQIIELDTVENKSSLKPRRESSRPIARSRLFGPPESSRSPPAVKIESAGAYVAIIGEPARPSRLRQATAQLQLCLSSDLNISTGIVSALSGLANDRRKIQISAPVRPGNSGGPLHGANGSIVGVVVAKLNTLAVAQATGDIPQNVNFAVSLGTLQSFLDANGVPYVLDDSSAKIEPADVATNAAQYTVLLECLN